MKMGGSDELPVVDFSLLTTEDSEQRSKAIQGLLEACRVWGFFILVNHGIPEAVTKALFSAAKEFFELPEVEKKQYEVDLYTLSLMKYGTHNVAYTPSNILHLWRNSLRLYLHPDELHFPHKPDLLREVLPEYSEGNKRVVKTLMEAIADALELDRDCVDEILKLDSSFQVFAANSYPPCPDAGRAAGLPPHTDAGLFTTVVHNGVPGLQIQKNGQWIDVESETKNSVWVVVADQLEQWEMQECEAQSVGE
ncbi:2-oxoglutarate-dependent dioxygenase 19-like isoform X2 [Andrographis paniculata]|uniref:2-oxoglutarate-dependent dioxygenase 19-like isoform X2 n=1 Tax=Andrographis paniculata TaxID=175694 RepID=UPI0021E8A39C|nr:2-oxoglutarate-dependent dioxygenase 19-like isoform X2 [Andrographis paniculata]